MPRHQAGRARRACGDLRGDSCRPAPHLGVRGIDGPIRAAVKGTVEPVGMHNRSRVSIDIEFVGYGSGELLVPLVVRPQARKEMAANMQRLKQRLEVVQRSPGG